jgi:glucose-6-phosphate dehydrogenase assembly protein OpcA
MANISSPSDQEPTLNTGAPVPVAIEYVQGQLHELWRHVAEAAQAKGGAHAVTTAQVLNLIVHAASHEAANEYASDIALLVGKHPSRVITMVNDPKETEMPVQAWVSISCQVPPAGGRQVCCEQISVSAGGDAVRQIPAAIIPLLMTELPVFLWWPQGAPFDDYLFRTLSASLDRLMVDSTTFENPEGTLATMSDLLKAEWPNISYTDMSWGRLTRWRELIAQFFDGPSLRPYLDRINNISIRFALSQRGGVNRAQALLLAGWLASRLGWQPANPVYELIRSEQRGHSAARLSLRAGSRPITLMLHPGPWQGDIPGEINSVVLEVLPDDAQEGSTPTPEARFTVALSDKEDECAWTCVELQGVEQTIWHVQMDTLRRVDLLDEELEVFSRDKVYEEALETAGLFIRGTTQDTMSIQPPRRVPTGEPMSAGARRNRPQLSTES